MKLNIILKFNIWYKWRTKWLCCAYKNVNLHKYPWADDHAIWKKHINKNIFIIQKSIIQNNNSMRTVDTQILWLNLAHSNSKRELEMQHDSDFTSIFSNFVYFDDLKWLFSILIWQSKSYNIGQYFELGLKTIWHITIFACAQMATWN